MVPWVSTAEAIARALEADGLSPARATERAWDILVLLAARLVPSTATLAHLRRDQRAGQLRDQGLSMALIAERLGLARATAYDAVARERRRKNPKHKRQAT